MPHPLRIHPAPVEWRREVPFSSAFADRYWSDHGDPRAEATEVFLDANRLDERWRQMAPGSAFSIGEIGFGTGLNFLCTWERWRRLKSPGCQLNYLAFDLRPPERQTLIQCHGRFHPIDSLSAQLADQLPRTGGIHRICLEPHTRLTLALGDAADNLQQLIDAWPFAVDCWFMDGFAPQRNPSAWSERLCRLMASASRAGTSLSSYSAAGSVRRALQRAGFTVERRTGFGGKKHRIEGHFDGQSGGTAPSPGSALIVGAGLAGSACAQALAARGMEVQLIEADRGSAASTNPAAILRPRLSARMSQSSLAWNLSGWALALRQLPNVPGSSWRQSGALQYLPDKRAKRRAHRLIAQRGLQDLWQLLDTEQASSLAGLNLVSDGRSSESWLHFPGAGQVELAGLCRALRTAAGIETVIAGQVRALEPCSAGWRALDAAGNTLAQARTCILATASAEGIQLPDIRTGTDQRYPDIQPMRGQMDRLEVLPGSTGLSMPLCGSGCLMPADTSGHWAGSSRQPHRRDLVPDAAERQHNVKRAARLLGLPEWPETADGPSWVATRWQGPDGLPVVGAAADGLYMSLGLGSRGLTFAFLAAELLASMMLGEPPPLTAEAVRSAAP